MSRPNLRKSPDLRKRDSPDLSKPSEPSFPEKDSESTPNSAQLGITRELGTVAGITIEARAKVDLESLLPAQGISVSRDESKNTLSIGAGVGTTRGKLGVNIGAEMGFEPDGSVSLKSASGGVNVAGFGVEGKAGQSGSGGLALTAFGITLDIARDEKGGISGGVSIQLPGGELGIGFQPSGTEIIEVPPQPPPLIEEEPPTPRYKELPPGAPRVSPPKAPIITPIVPPGIETTGTIKRCSVVIVINRRSEWMTDWGEYKFGEINTRRTTVWDSGWKTTSRRTHWNILEPDYTAWNYTTSDSSSGDARKPYGPSSYGNIYYTRAKPNEQRLYCEVSSNSFAYFLSGHEPAIMDWISRMTESYLSLRLTSPDGYSYLKQVPTILRGDGSDIPDPRENGWTKTPNDASFRVDTYDHQVIDSSCGLPDLQPPGWSVPTFKKIQLPNFPQQQIKQIKPMDCCTEIKEIHKYLGIAKLKKNKFPVSNAFLVPGGKGNDNCVDYYAITQALFRMLANGLILNPKSKPLGSEWQNINATAWAGQMYEMMAESMSDGNSSQRFEVAAIMQLVQIMSAVAETGRKVEFVADAIGIEPQPVSEELPVCFTVHESHKGFGDSKPKKLKTSGLKTDEQVEEVLGKMLKPSKIPIVKWQFRPGQISINEALRNNG